MISTINKLNPNDILSTMGICDRTRYSLHNKDGTILEIEPLKHSKKCVVGIHIDNVCTNIQSFINLILDSVTYGNGVFLYELFLDSKIKNFFIDEELEYTSIVSLNGERLIYEHDVNNMDYITVINKLYDVVMYIEIPLEISNKKYNINYILHNIKQLINLF